MMMDLIELPPDAVRQSPCVVQSQQEEVLVLLVADPAPQIPGWGPIQLEKNPHKNPHGNQQSKPLKNLQ